MENLEILNNLSPAVRKIVTEKNLKLEGIRGSGSVEQF